MIQNVVPEWKPPSSPQELLDKLPLAMPMSSSLYEVQGFIGVYKYNKDLFSLMPEMDWRQFYEMSRQAATGQWQTPPGTEQVRVQMPPQEVLPHTEIKAICDAGGYRVPPGLAIPPTRNTSSATPDEAGQGR